MFDKYQVRIQFDDDDRCIFTEIWNIGIPVPRSGDMINLIYEGKVFNAMVNYVSYKINHDLIQYKPLITIFCINTTISREI